MKFLDLLKEEEEYQFDNEDNNDIPKNVDLEYLKKKTFRIYRAFKKGTVKIDLSTGLRSYSFNLGYELYDPYFNFVDGYSILSDIQSGKEPIYTEILPLIYLEKNDLPKEVRNMESVRTDDRSSQNNNWKIIQSASDKITQKFKNFRINCTERQIGYKKFEGDEWM